MRITALLALAASLWLSASMPASAQGDTTTLQPDRLPGMCLTMTGPAVQAMSLPCTGGKAEKFGLPDHSGRPIRYDGKCLAPRGDGNYPALAAAECDGSPEQTWTMNEEGELRSAAGRCISLLGQSSRTGELIFAGECPPVGQAHVWRARNVDFTNVIEASLESIARPGHCIGYDTGLALYPCTDAYRQVMSFDEKAFSQFRMMSICLSGGNVFSAVRLGECRDTWDHKWFLLTGNRIANNKAECITISDENGRTFLRINPCTTAIEQQWRVRRPPPSVSAPAPEANPELPSPPIAPEPVPTIAPAVAPAASTVTTLRHEQLPGMCMSLSGPKGESESQPCDGSEKQNFKLPSLTGPILNNGRCLVSRGQGTYPQLSAVDCDGSPDQAWTITPTGEVHSAAGRCLSLLGISSRNGERIYAGECPTGLPAHRWRAISIDPALLKPQGAMLESAARPGKCLGTDGALGLVECRGKLGRVFSFDFSGPSQLRMMGSCLAGGYVADALTLGQCWDLPGQKWSLNAAGNLVNLQGRCIVLTVDHGRDVPRGGACLAVTEQQWVVKPLEP